MRLWFLTQKFFISRGYFMGFLVLLLVAAAAIIAAAFVINYFWRVGFRRGAAYAAFFVAIFFVFWGSGLWLDAKPEDWGVLAPLFALIMGASWIVILIVRRLWRLYRKKDEHVDENEDED